MTQSTTETKRQAIQAKKQKKQEELTEILAGVVDNESKTYTFQKTISMSGGEKKTGSFTAKYMSVADRLRVGTLRARLLEGAPEPSLDVLTSDIAYMMAYLSVSLVKTPSWWNYEDIDEIEDLKDMYLEVMKFLEFFRGQNEQNTNAGSGSITPSKETMETE